jgi:putative ABC transport system ATP-binding protein
MSFLTAEKLVKEYKRRGKTFRAVDDIDLEIGSGELVMIEGESGSGKTTLLNLLTGLTDPTSGSVTIEGKDLKSLDDKTISGIRNEKIKYIPQGESLLSSLTVKENILFPFVVGGKIIPSGERLLEVAGKLGILELLDEYPSELSGGEMRRVTIARAVINRPSLIIADEPTGSLDSVNTSKVMDIFKTVAEEGTAVIVVTHQKETLRYASRVLSMEKGKLREVS